MVFEEISLRCALHMSYMLESHALYMNSRVGIVTLEK